MLKTATLSLFLVFSLSITAQNSVIKGVVKNTNKEPIEGVTISYLNYGVTTNKKGEYKLAVPGNTKIKITSNIKT